MSDETSIQKPEAEAVVEAKANHEEDEVIQSSTDEIKTPKRTPKRRSFIERAQRESEELVRTMGGSLELEGGRRTRSSTRGTPTRAAEDVTPPPSKKARTSPTTTKSTSRGRGARKLDVGDDDEVDQGPTKSEPAEEVQSTEPVKAKAAGKKSKKDEKAEKPKEVIGKGKKDVRSPASESKSTDSKVVETTESKKIEVTESKDQTDAVKEPPALPEEQQNNVDHDNKSTKESEIIEKTSDELPKTEEPAKAETTPKTDAATPVGIESMEVDDEEKQNSTSDEADADKTPTNASAPVITESVEKNQETAKASPKKLSIEHEPAKQESPEPMEVDTSSKSSSETVNAISPVKESAPDVVDAVQADAAPKPPSNNEVVEVATEAKEDASPAPEKEVVAVVANSAVVEAKTPVIDETPASNDVSKPTSVAASDPVVTDSTDAEPVKEPQAKCDNKTEHNDNGEPKIVNNAAEDGENHVTPQACN